MQQSSLGRTVLVLLFLFLVLAGLYYAKGFLVPVAFAGLLAMLLMPVSVWLERKGFPRVLAIIISMLVLIAFFAGIIWLLTWQVSDLAKDAGNIEKNLLKKLGELKKFISDTFGISLQKQNEIFNKQKENAGSGGAQVTGLFAMLGGFLTNLVLCLVYIFLFLYFRSHIKKFILKLVPDEKMTEAQEVIENSREVAQKYLTGLAMMIGCLWVMYSIGFSIVGVKSPIFFAILCGLLEIVPFVGNLAGTSITVLVSIAQGGDSSLIIGILITYALVQFIQTYILEPLVVGAEVNINPLFTIMGIVIGEMVWGIPGMILAIPLLAIVKIICDHVEALKPYGFLLGTDKTKKTEKKKSVRGKKNPSS